MQCLECQKEMPPTHRHDRKFCGVDCRNKFNNRQQERGKQLYPLFMAMRFDRAGAKEAGAWAVMCRMASEWNEEDKARGVKSFPPINEVLERNVQFVGKRYNINRRAR